VYSPLSSAELGEARITQTHGILTLIGPISQRKATAMPWKDKDKYKSDRYKQYISEYNKSWYQRHKAKRLASNYERKARMYELYQEIKSTLRCADCGENHPAALHFHHKNPKEKEFNVADFVRSGKSVEALHREIEKCVVLCANCHAKRHYEQSKKVLQTLGVSGQLAEMRALLEVTEEEEFAYAAVFGTSGDTEQEYKDYQEYFGVDPRNRE
jgi:hypothetical protein